jgi:hypothetical protein
MIDLSVLCDRFHPIEQGYIIDEREYKLNMVGMMDLSVLCDRYYPTEQGYITGERGVHIDQGSDDRSICSM